jgi:hypothetical protein
VDRISRIFCILAITAGLILAVMYVDTMVGHQRATEALLRSEAERHRAAGSGRERRAQDPAHRRTDGIVLPSMVKPHPPVGGCFGMSPQSPVPWPKVGWSWVIVIF